MSVFIELKKDEQILQAVANYEIILLVGCTECANISIAYEKGYPLASRQYLENVMSWKPHAIYEEIERIKRMLKNQGKKVVSEVERPCMLNDDKDLFLNENRTDIHAILCIGCIAGKVGIEKTVGDSVPVIMGANTVGLIQYHVDITNQKLFINRNKSTVIKFGFDISESIDIKDYWDFVNKL